MVDLIDHQPRAPISDEQMKLFLWAMKECKTPGVPGFRALRTWQAKRAQTTGFRPTHHVTALNNEYYANHPAELFRFVSRIYTVLNRSGLLTCNLEPRKSSSPAAHAPISRGDGACL